MIISVWKPKFKGKKFDYYELADLKDLKTGWKIVYKCDVCGNIDNSGSASMMKAEWNNLESQMCRKCRSIKSERLKDGIITYEKFKDKIENDSYRVVSTKEEFESQLYPSQAKMNVICDKGHSLHVTWNNYINKDKRCRQCYEENKYNDAVKYKDGFDLYKYLVYYYTNISYNKYIEKINPDGLDRGHSEYHLDHKYSIAEGFRKSILPIIIGNVCNLRIITAKKNIQKHDKCSITRKQLFKEYNI